jgi:hypothetical protein
MTASPALVEDAQIQIRIRIRETTNGQDIPCRVHLKNDQGAPIRPEGLPFFRDHFVCPGSFLLRGTQGTYSYEIERGPEYEITRGKFELRGGTNPDLTLHLQRIVDLASEGWWSGELHVHRPLEEIRMLMLAEDLHMAPVITWWNNANRWATQAPPQEPVVSFDEDRFYEVMAGEDEREGGALLFFGLKQPLKIAGASRESPSPMEFLLQAKEQPGAWVDVEKPFWWDVPVWVASGLVDSVGLANNHMCRGQMYETEAWGKPRDAGRLPPPTGNGYWSQEIYYHLLNCGLRIPPSAGSASGVLPNPVGYNRVYVQLGPRMAAEDWWRGLRAGRSFVSNGPLLRCRANGQWPGHVFQSPEGSELHIDLSADLTSRDPLRSIDIVKNGVIERSVPFDDWAKSGAGSLGSIVFRESGWFLVRTIAENPKTFRFASSAPFYVEIGKPRKRVSRGSAQFFLDWVRERKGRVKVENPEERKEVLAYHEQAEKFWSALVDSANVP